MRQYVSPYTYLHLLIVLSPHLVAGVYQDELNPDNPLGMGGAIAGSIGTLIGQIWSMEFKICPIHPDV
jgi:ubiquitin carboxyl-terminal hydrolase 4/11/15